LYASSFAISSAPQFGATRVSRTIGVFPIRSARFSVMARVGGETLTVPRVPGYSRLSSESPISQNIGGQSPTKSARRSALPRSS
jgi:hypothetical protein